jgi:predicted DNA binding CopG/RHH family protein
MEKKTTSYNPQDKVLNILLPEKLINRVNVVCADKNMTIQEFVTDAIIYKIKLVYKERRKKPRL